jgi:hypothetical protein
MQVTGARVGSGGVRRGGVGSGGVRWGFGDIANAWSFCHLNILSICHFVNYHFVNWLFCQNTIFYIPFCQLGSVL